MRRLVWMVVAAFALATILTGCSDPIQAGTVVKKVYDDEDHWRYWQTEYCPYFASINGTTYIFYSACGGHYANGYDPAHWQFRLQDDTDPKHHGWVEVTEDEYGRYDVGSHWPDPR